MLYVEKLLRKKMKRYMFINFHNSSKTKNLTNPVSEGRCDACDRPYKVLRANYKLLTICVMSNYRGTLGCHLSAHKLSRVLLGDRDVTSYYRR